MTLRRSLVFMLFYRGKNSLKREEASNHLALFFTPAPFRRIRWDVLSLVLIGCGAMAVDQRTGALTHVGVAAVWGLVVMVMIYSLGRISGAHINPAVTIAFAAYRGFPVKDAAAFCLTQVVAAILAAAAMT